MLKLKEKYKGKNIKFKGKELVISEIPFYLYKYYFDNGLKDLFEVEKIKPLSNDKNREGRV